MCCFWKLEIKRVFVKKVNLCVYRHLVTRNAHYTGARVSGVPRKQNVPQNASLPVGHTLLQFWRNGGYGWIVREWWGQRQWSARYFSTILQIISCLLSSLLASRRFLADAINLSIAIGHIEMSELVPKTVRPECEYRLFVAVCVVDRICLF